MKAYFLGILIVPLLALLHAREMNKEKAALAAPPTHADSLKTGISYRLAAVDDTIADWLIGIRSEDSLKVLYFLNRTDGKGIKRQDSIIIPDIFYTDVMMYSPFPAQVKDLEEIEKIIIFSYPIQAFAAYEYGKLIRWGPTSMGKESTPTPTGLFHTNWRSKWRRSSIDPTWIMEWYFNIESERGISMHEYSLPGYPASHACLRLLHDDAYFFYYWAEGWRLSKKGYRVADGTPVVIFGKYPFGNRQPWRMLAEAADAVQITEEALHNELQPYLLLIMQRQGKSPETFNIL